MLVKQQEQFRKRVYVLTAFFLVWSFLLVFRLFDLQIFQYVSLSNRAKRQHSRSFEVSPKRGTIFDRRNRELAVSINVDSIFAVSSEIVDQNRTVHQLAAALNLNSQDLRTRLNNTRGFAWIKRKVDYPEAQRVRSLELPGIYFEKESKRFYPKRELAAHVVGYVGMDNEGLSGLEFAYEKKVRGTGGRILLMADAKQRSFSSVERSPTAGQDLVLTIDEYIQYLVEQELVAQVRKSQALGGTAVVMDPYSGEILAMASVPTFNPNHFGKYSPEQRMNGAILSIYEPGSTFKIITAATALEEHLAKPDEQINCLNGSIVISSRRIRDHKPYGWLSVREIVARSSNVGAIQLGFRIGKDRFERYIRNFGFGEPTGVDLPGEARGLVRPASEWPAITLGTISMGHGIGVTPLQLLTAVSAIANGGYLAKPHVVRETRRGPLQQVNFEPEPTPKRVLSPETTALIKSMLTGVVTRGTGKAAQLEGFSSAGKTGTAQKIEPNGRYSHSKFIASFVGFAPIEKPVIAVVVTIDEPRGLYYGGEVAAPVFRGIAEKSLRYLSVSPDQPLRSTQIAKRRVHEEDTAKDVDPDQFELLEFDWEVIPITNPAKVETSVSSPLTDAPVARYDNVDLGDSTAVEIPDFTGKSLRAVMTESSKAGLQLSIVGSGLAVEQHPAPYTRVAYGSKITVRFSRQL